MSLFRALIEVQVKHKRYWSEIDVIEGEMTLLISEEDLGVMGVDILCTRRTIAIDGEVQDKCMREPGSLHIVLSLVDEKSSGQKAAFQSTVGYECCADGARGDAGMPELSRVDDSLRVKVVPVDVMAIALTHAEAVCTAPTSSCANTGDDEEAGVGSER